jgi:type VI secretion system protein ImpA
MNDSATTDPLLAAIDGNAPAGPNLEYDAAFTELEQIAMPTPERAMGDSLKAAQEPDWDKVAHAAEALLARSKDLRVAVHLCAARTRKHGLAGWAAGLALVRGLLERYWDDVHPQLDADDDNDSTARANALMPLADPQSTLGYLRLTPFVQSPRLGRFSLRDLRVATGAITAAPSADRTPAPTLVDLEACCMDCSDDQLPTASALLGAAQDHAQAIAGLLRERLGTAGPDMSTLRGDIDELKKFVDAQVLRRFPAGIKPAADTGDAAAQSGDGAAHPGSASAPAAPGKITSHDDVIRRLDDLCEYYARVEPSSPLPVLLKRARRLVGKSFAEVLRDIAPGGLSELQTLVGPDSD